MRRLRPQSIFVFSLALLLGSTTFFPRVASAQAITVEGWFHIVWGEVAHFDLTDDTGRSWILKADEKVFATVGGAEAVNGKRVRVDGTRIAAPADTIVISAITLVGAAPHAFTGPTPMAAVTSQPFVNILCEFPGTQTQKPVSHYQRLMGGQYPGLNHYWLESSYGLLDIAGTVVVGPYTLPNSRSYYVFDHDGDGVPEVDFQRTVTDCTAEADPDVNFPDFFGINQIFSDNIGGPTGRTSWGGSRTLNLDGQIQNYGVTWMSLAGQQHQYVIAHEMGHSFGLPHSSGPYNQTYDSEWDVMSGGGLCSPRDPVFGCIGPHTISHHKDKLGWFAPNQKLDVNQGETATITLERLANPRNNNNFLMARILIPNSPIFYTVEAREFSGYDTQIPGEGVLIHRVDSSIASLQVGQARVVDRDNNGNPNDAGAIWTVGEKFSTVDGVPISVSVNSATSTAYQVTVCNDPPPSVLTVNKVGAGTGTVVGSSSVINCGADCVENFTSCALVTLKAKPAAGSVFVKWTGDCTGRGACKVAMGADRSVTAMFEIEPPPLTLAGIPLPPGEETIPYNASVAIAGGYPPYVATVVGSKLPLGMSFLFPDLSGTPTEAGNARVTLKIEDQLGKVLKKTLKAKFLAAVNITNAGLKSGKAGQNYSAELKAAGGLKPFTWSINGGQPSWLILDPQTGKISGLPPIPEIVDLNFQVTDSLGASHQKLLQLIIN